jgi:hypothetical protein
MKASPRRTKQDARPFWAEFYSLSEDCGITFAATGVQLFGGILRIELPVEKGKYPDDRWMDVCAKDGEYFVNGRNWTDFGCSLAPWQAFRRLTARQARIAVECGGGQARIDGPGGENQYPQRPQSQDAASGATGGPCGRARETNHGKKRR